MKQKQKRGKVGENRKRKAHLLFVFNENIILMS